MANVINATSTGNGGLVSTGDDSGILNIQTNETTAITVDASQKVSFTNPIQGGSITSGTAVASTSGTSIDFTSIPSWVKRITVMFNGVSLNASVNFLVQIGSGSITTTGYNSTGSYLPGGTPGIISSTAGFVMLADSSAFTISGTLTIFNISSNIWVSSHAIKSATTSSGTGGGDVTLSGVLDRVRITSTNGTATFDAGSINILYEG